MRLEGKVAVIVGAGQSPGEGIGNGRATALRFAQEGARILAVDVLPVPRGPQKRKACESRPSRIAPTSARTTCSCPMTSSGVWGRYFR